MKGILGGSAVRSDQVVHDFVWSSPALGELSCVPSHLPAGAGAAAAPSKPSLALAAPTASSLWACPPVLLHCTCYRLSVCFLYQNKMLYLAGV